MPSKDKDIVRGIRTLIQNKLIPAVDSRWSSQFSFGLEAYVLREFNSASINTQMVVANASSKSRRLLGNQP